MLVVYFTNYSSFDNHFWVLVMIPRAQAYRGIPVRWIGGILSITAGGGGGVMIWKARSWIVFGEWHANIQNCSERPREVEWGNPLYYGGGGRL